MKAGTFLCVNNFFLSEDFYSRFIVRVTRFYGTVHDHRFTYIFCLTFGWRDDGGWG